ncbi:MAG: N-acetylneuraminate synthase family protein [Candidatus Berkiella sp.]
MDFISSHFDFKKVDRCIVIGEIGVNHNNNAELLFKLIDEGIKAGVDIIKLQRFSADAEISSYAPKAEYQTLSGPQGESQLEMAKKLQLPDELIYKAHEYCKSKNIGFLCAAFDHQSVDFIADTLKNKTIKVPSPELSNIPLLEHMARKFPALLVSTGASYLSECLAAVELLENQGVQELVLMHCVSEYPAPIEDANLRAITTMQQATQLPIGYSDHTVGITAPIVAASLGSVLIEKHYTLDKTLPGPDHRASADIQELATMVKAVREASLSLGSGLKRPVESEVKNRPIIRKCLVVNNEYLEAGTSLVTAMLGVKRPEVPGAVLPIDLNKIIGLKLKRAKSYDEPIMWSDFE